jgi:ribokinase
MTRIVIAGSINMDVVARTERHPRPGESVFGHDLRFVPGGKGSNQATAAGRLGGDVTFVGRLGKDAFGESLHASLKGEPLDLAYLRFSEDAPTGTALIIVDENGENSIVIVPGANGTMTPADVAEAPLAAGDVAVSQFEVPQAVIVALFERARAAGATTVLNPAPMASFADGLMALIDVLVVNETELALLAGVDTIPEALDDISAMAVGLRHTPRQTIVVTLGGRGALCIAGDERHHVPARQVTPVDTTGAGDCFTGGLAVGLAEGRPLPDVLRFAGLAASISVERPGAATSLPTRGEVEALVSLLAR